MTKISDDHVPYNAGWAGQLKQGQIPSPFNLNRHMNIDGISELIEHPQVRPQPGNFMDLRAQMDLLGAPSAYPDLAVGDKPLDVSIYNS